MKMRWLMTTALGGMLLALFSLHAEEQLEQEPISIKGNRGLPRTLYIAPWKRVGEPPAKGRLEGELPEESDPLEPDLLQRELELYREGYSVD